MKTLCTLAALLATVCAGNLHSHGQLQGELHHRDYEPESHTLSAPQTQAVNSSCAIWSPLHASEGCESCSCRLQGSQSHHDSRTIDHASQSHFPSSHDFLKASLETTDSSAASHMRDHAASAASSPSNLAISTKGNWAIAYSPYTGSDWSSSSCKSAAHVTQDISAIAAKGFSAVRIYATDCNQLEYVAAACQQHALKMIVGIFIESNGIGQDAYDQLDDIMRFFNTNYNLVEMVVIGNEALFNGYCTGHELASFISHSATVLRSAGYTGPITTADTVGALQANAGILCPVIDVLGANIYPFFNGNVEAQDSGAFIDGQLRILETACPGKVVYNLESGWPSQGPRHMGSVASMENQAAFVKAVLASPRGRQTVFASHENDLWKHDGSDSVEAYFGCLDHFEDM